MYPLYSQSDEKKHVWFIVSFYSSMPVLLTSAAAILLATALQVETFPALVAMVRAVCPSSVFARSCVVSCIWDTFHEDGGLGMRIADNSNRYIYTRKR